MILALRVAPLVFVAAVLQVATISGTRIHERVKYRLIGQPAIYRYIRHFTSPKALADRVSRHGLELLEAHYYAHFTRAASLARSIGLSPRLTEDLFVAVFRKA